MQGRAVTQYIIKRLLLAVLVLWIVSVIVFSAVRVIPGDVCKIVTAGQARGHAVPLVHGRRLSR
jgi:ABC-type dipeptide/oligopeptide/nickel transport system permease component